MRLEIETRPEQYANYMRQRAPGILLKSRLSLKSRPLIKNMRFYLYLLMSLHK